MQLADKNFFIAASTDFLKQRNFPLLPWFCFQDHIYPENVSLMQVLKKKKKKKKKSELQTYHLESTFFYILYYIYPINVYQK